MFQIKINERELHTLIAALSLYQDIQAKVEPDYDWLFEETATNGGEVESLTVDEVQDVKDRINFSEAVI